MGFHLGGIPFLIFVELLLLSSLWEFFSLTAIKMFWWQKMLLLLTAAAVPLKLHFVGYDYLPHLFVVALFLCTLPYTMSHIIGDIGRSIGLSFFGVSYLTAGCASLIILRAGQIVAPELAAGWVIFLFASIWIVDTAAYWIGSQFGRHKLSPAISPNKTVEGFFGGFVGALAAALLFSLVFLSEVGFVRLIAPALVIAFFGQLGDLVESIFKREHGVKDSSNLIPGHGGILDRFDSLMFAAPALLLYLALARAW